MKKVDKKFIEKTIHKNIENALKVFKEKNYYDISEFEFPTITFNLKGKTAGKAYLKNNNIRLNSELLFEHNNEYFKEMTLDTPLHELAHLIVYFLIKKKIFDKNLYKPHGHYWLHVMKLLEAPNLSVTHSMNNELIDKKKNLRILFSCSCGYKHWISKHKYTKIKNGREYICTICNDTIRQIGIDFVDYKYE